jgi:uncharacterized membrane-anchored protein
MAAAFMLSIAVVDLAAIAARYLAPLILSGIAAGVIGKYLYDYAVRYFKAVDKSKVGWDWKGFLLTALVSFVIAILMYGLVFERVRVGELGKRFAE